MLSVHIFRVHFVDGAYVDIAAETPKAARQKAEKRHPDARITKVKILRGEAV